MLFAQRQKAPNYLKKGHSTLSDLIADVCLTRHKQLPPACFPSPSLTLQHFLFCCFPLNTFMIMHKAAENKETVVYVREAPSIKWPVLRDTHSGKQRSKERKCWTGGISAVSAIIFTLGSHGRFSRAQLVCESADVQNCVQFYNLFL